MTTPSITSTMARSSGVVNYDAYITTIKKDVVSPKVGIEVVEWMGVRHSSGVLEINPHKLHHSRVMIQGVGNDISPNQICSMIFHFASYVSRNIDCHISRVELHDPYETIDNVLNRNKSRLCVFDNPERFKHNFLVISDSAIEYTLYYKNQESS